MMPEGESPLLLPANQHKQLVVIDFEYANANLPGLEFANHFVSSLSSSFSNTSAFYIDFTHRELIADMSRPNGRIITTMQTHRGGATISTIQRSKSSIASFEHT